MFYGCHLILDHQRASSISALHLVPLTLFDQKTLDHFATPEFSLSSSLKFKKAYFLITYHLGLWSPKLHALNCHVAWMNFPSDDPQVSLVPAPKVLTKWKCEGHRHNLDLFPAWVEDGCPHLLCFVSARQQYLDAARQSSLD